MNKTRRLLMIAILVVYFATSGCSLIRAAQPTVTPSPTATSSPTETSMPTKTPLPNVTPTPQATMVANCEQYGNVSIHDNLYIVQNGMWNPSPGGAQCLDVNNLTGAYTVTSQTNQSTGGAPSSYPFIYMGCHWGTCTSSNTMPVRVDAISSAVSSWDVTTADGVWNVSYDIWFNTTPTTGSAPDGAELMIWLNSQGPIQPAGAVIAKAVKINGEIYDVWHSQGSGAQYIAYRKINKSTSQNTDILAFINDAVSRGYIQPEWYLIAVESGFEIWKGGVGLSTNSFSVSVSN